MPRNRRCYAKYRESPFVVASCGSGAANPTRFAMHPPVSPVDYRLARDATLSKLAAFGRLQGGAFSEQPACEHTRREGYLCAVRGSGPIPRLPEPGQMPRKPAVPGTAVTECSGCCDTCGGCRGVGAASWSTLSGGSCSAAEGTHAEGYTERPPYAQDASKAEHPPVPDGACLAVAFLAGGVPRLPAMHSRCNCESCDEWGASFSTLCRRTGGEECS